MRHLLLPAAAFIVVLTGAGSASAFTCAQARDFVAHHSPETVQLMAKLAGPAETAKGKDCFKRPAARPPSPAVPLPRARPDVVMPSDVPATSAHVSDDAPHTITTGLPIIEDAPTTAQDEIITDALVDPIILVAAGCLLLFAGCLAGFAWFRRSTRRRLTSLESDVAKFKRALVAMAAHVGLPKTTAPAL